MYSSLGVPYSERTIGIVAQDYIYCPQNGKQTARGFRTNLSKRLLKGGENQWPGGAYV